MATAKQILDDIREAMGSVTPLPDPVQLLRDHMISEDADPADGARCYASHALLAQLGIDPKNPPDFVQVSGLVPPNAFWYCKIPPMAWVPLSEEN